MRPVTALVQRRRHNNFPLPCNKFSRARECDNLPARLRAASCRQRRRPLLRTSSSRPEGSPRPCHHPGKQGCQYRNTAWHRTYRKSVVQLQAHDLLWPRLARLGTHGEYVGGAAPAADPGATGSVQDGALAKPENSQDGVARTTHVESLLVGGCCFMYQVRPPASHVRNCLVIPGGAPPPCFFVCRPRCKFKW